MRNLLPTLVVRRFNSCKKEETGMEDMLKGINGRRRKMKGIDKLILAKFRLKNLI